MLTARVPLSSPLCPEQDAEVSRAVFFPRGSSPLFGTLTVVARNRGVETGQVTLVANQSSDLDALIRCATELRALLADAERENYIRDVVGGEPTVSLVGAA